MIATLEQLIDILRAKVQKKNVECHDLGIGLEWRITFDEGWCCIGMTASPLDESFYTNRHGYDAQCFFWEENVPVRIDEWLDPIFENAIQDYIKSNEEGEEND